MSLNLIENNISNEEVKSIDVCKNKNLFDKIVYTNLRITNFEHKKYEFLKYLLSDIQKETFLVKYDKKVIGIFSLKYEKNKVYLFDFSVNNSYRGRGFGTIILKQILYELKEFGYSKLFLYALKDNKRAIKLYEKIGFKTIRVLKGM